MRPIPEKMRRMMAVDPFYARCCITGKPAGKYVIEWHHNLQYKGRQVNAIFCILPLWEGVHEMIKSNREVRDLVDWIMLGRATDEELRKFQRRDFSFQKARLEKMFGVFDIGTYQQNKFIQKWH